jgi:hypothetical protein
LASAEKLVLGLVDVRNADVDERTPAADDPARSGKPVH